MFEAGKTLKYEGNALKTLKEETAKETFGITKEEAHKAGICVQCRKPALPRCYSAAGEREYQISGLCEMCFDDIFEE